MMDLFAKLRGMHLLLIDDDEWVRESLKLYFESEGCRIIALEIDAVRLEAEDWQISWRADSVSRVNVIS